jgi:hypothetical protein
MAVTADLDQGSPYLWRAPCFVVDQDSHLFHSIAHAQHSSSPGEEVGRRVRRAGKD